VELPPGIYNVIPAGPEQHTILVMGYWASEMFEHPGEENRTPVKCRSLSQGTKESTRRRTVKGGRKGIVYSAHTGLEFSRPPGVKMAQRSK